MLSAIPLAVRIGAPIALALVLAGGWYLYKESLRSEGREEIRAEHAEAVQAQQEDVRKVELQQHKEALAAVEKIVAHKDWVHEQLLQKQKAKEAEIQTLRNRLAAVQSSRPDVEVQYVEVEKLVEVPVAQPCMVPEHLVASIDRVSSLLNTLAHRRLSDTGRAAEDLTVESTRPVTCAQLVRWADTLASRYANAMIEHKGLDDYIMQQVELNREFRQRHAE